ncbi:MAG: DUF1109 family protein, partial [Alphaproteobacteria bacterium]|nr:DUF1109 family protein [Alphaproteobacteria bacterium]
MSKMRTDDLIQRLAADVKPVQCLRPPVFRLGRWLLLSVPWVAAVVYVMGLRPDLATRLVDTR